MNERNWKMYKRKMRIDEKLHSGWWWFKECFEVWAYCMMNPEEDPCDFFCHICSDYVGYEEEFYYE